MKQSPSNRRPKIGLEPRDYRVRFPTVSHRVSSHGLRHQYATAAREAGIDMGVISKNMGHASVAITEDIYAHITSNVLEEAALKIENQLFGK